MLFVKAVLFAALFMNCYCDENSGKKVVEVEKLLRYINSNAATAKQNAKSGSSSYPSGKTISLSAKSYRGSNSFGSAPSAPSVYSYGVSSSDSSSFQPQISPSASLPSNYGLSPSLSNSKPLSQPNVEFDDSYGYNNFYGMNMGQDLTNNFFGGSNLVASQPGNGQVFCQEMRPIFEGDIASEQYCRCSDGSYGITCTEGFGNPCLFGNSQFFPADPRLSRSYFIHCSWNIPHLKKCPAHLFWNQDLVTCAWA